MNKEFEQYEFYQKRPKIRPRLKEDRTMEELVEIPKACDYSDWKPRKIYVLPSEVSSVDEDDLVKGHFTRIKTRNGDVFCSLASAADILLALYHPYHISTQTTKRLHVKQVEEKIDIMDKEIQRLRKIINDSFMKLPLVPGNDMCWVDDNLDCFVTQVADEWAIRERQIEALKEENTRLRASHDACKMLLKAIRIYEMDDDLIRLLIQQIEDIGITKINHKWISHGVFPSVQDEKQDYPLGEIYIDDMDIDKTKLKKNLDLVCLLVNNVEFIIDSLKYINELNTTKESSLLEDDLLSRWTCEEDHMEERYENEYVDGVLTGTIIFSKFDTQIHYGIRFMDEYFWASEYTMSPSKDYYQIILEMQKRLDNMAKAFKYFLQKFGGVKMTHNEEIAEDKRRVDYINLNEMAVEISNREGGKRQVNIAQIKEVLMHTLNILSDHYHDNPRKFKKLMEEYHLGEPE